MLRLFLSTRAFFHVIAVTETWLDPRVDSSSVVFLDNYTLIRCDRNNHGGGVAFFIHNSISATFLCSSDGNWSGKPGTPEYLFCELCIKGHPPIFAAVVYRPPHAPFIKGTDFIDKITTYMHNYSTKIIQGDFNADQLSSNEDATFIRKFIIENGLHSIPYGATHHKPDSDTWLDLCLVDQQDPVLDFWKTETPFINGHDLTTTTLAWETPLPAVSSFSYRDYKNINADSLINLLNDLEWPSEELTLEEHVAVLQSHLSHAVDLLAPVKIVSPNKKRHPWFSSEHRNMLRERDRLYRRFRRTRLPIDLLEYRHARDLAHRSIEEARLCYYHSRLAPMSDPKLIWRELGHLGIAKSKKSVESPFTTDEHNAYFSSISFDPETPPVSVFLDSLSTYTHDEYMSFDEIQISDVYAAVNHFDTQARGPDGIPQHVVKLALPFLAPIICRIFNQSLHEAQFPSLWKKSVIIALSKVNTPTSLSDFRPISLLCFLSKALEWLVHKQISAYLESRLLLNPLQTGYRAGHSTQTGLLKLTDDIRIGIDKKLVTLLLLFDFSKAFDSVCHVKLLKKLPDFGFSKDVIRWIASYLTNREQAVIDIKGKCSSFLRLNTGVPQGSVLGPLLFAIYVNELPLCLDHDISHLMYADDLQIYISCPLTELDAISAKMSENADRINSWATLNNLKLNVKKTKAIVIGSPYFINLLPSVAKSFIVIGDTQVDYESSLRSLGVVLDSKLSWKEHIAHITQRVRSLMYRLYHFRKSTTFQLRKHLIQMLLFPLIDYCCLVYCNLSSELELKLQRLVNTGIRYIFGVKRWEHITPFRKELGWLSTAGRRKYFAACLLHKMFNTATPLYLLAYFNSFVTTRPVRGEIKPLVIPSFCTETLKESFHVISSYLWNSLPSHIRNITSISSFKNHLYQHFLDTES